MKQLFLSLTCFVFFGCFKKYSATIRVCSDGLYVEGFQVNPAGVYADYLTDSATFRVYIGKFDPEQNYYYYRCAGDSVYVTKIQRYENVGATSFKLVNKVVLWNFQLKCRTKIQRP